MNPETPSNSTRPDAASVAGDQALLIRYYAGLCDAAERAQAEVAISESRDERVFFQAFTSAVTHGTPEPTDAELASAISTWRTRTVEAPLQDAEDPGFGADRATPSMWGRRMWYTLAGVTASALSVLLVSTTHRTAPSTPRPSQAAVTSYSTNNGQRATITLPDGSTASLNVGSRLELPMDFGPHNRTLTLDGEALFTVAHNRDAPFTVRAGATSTRVLGTTFTVRHYATDSITRVAVRDGRVAVQNVVLGARQQADVSPDGTARVHDAEAARFSFASGVLTLDGVPLKNAVADLNRWFDADIRVTDPALAEHHIDGTFAAGTLADLSKILELTFEARVERAGRVLTLYPK